MEKKKMVRVPATLWQDAEDAYAKHARRGNWHDSDLARLAFIEGFVKAALEG